MAVDIRSTANFGAYLKDRCKVIGARIKSDGTQVRGWRHKKKEGEGSPCVGFLFSFFFFTRARALSHALVRCRNPRHLRGRAQIPSPARARHGDDAPSRRQRSICRCCARRRVLPARAGGGGSFLSRSVVGRAHPSSSSPKTTNTKPYKQDLYVAVVKATIEEETVPKEKHVRS
jgi:hypothetical protein